MVFSLFVNSIPSASFASLDNEQSLLCSVDKADDEDKVKNQDFSLEHNDDSTLKANSSKVAILSQEKIDGIKTLAEKLDIPFETLLEKLRLNLNSGESYLVPLIETEEHKNCLLDIFCYANPEYMKYYLDGKLKTLEKAELIFFINSLKRMWQGKTPRSLNFIIDVNNNSIGRIAIGPLYERRTIDSEIGYAIKEEYSGKGITSEAVKTLVELLRYLIQSGKYDIEKIRATAKEGNIASNKILQRNGFIKMPEMVDDGYSPENEYFYYFK